MFCADEHGTSALHIAALQGHRDSIITLTKLGHPPNNLDKSGWPPLLYAIFENHQECALILMRKDPHQLSLLGQLLKRDLTDEARERNHHIIKCAVTTIASHEEFFRILNDFIRRNPDMLDAEFSFFFDFKGLLDFDNKVSWLRRRLNKESQNAYPAQGSCFVEVIRECPFDCAHQVFCSREHLPISINVQFVNEPGICLGPMKEFFSILTDDICKNDRGLFRTISGNPGIQVPCEHWSRDGQKLHNKHHLSMFRTVGALIGYSIRYSVVFGLKLAPCILKQVLGRPVEHPKDLETFDPMLFKSLTWMQDINNREIIRDLELQFQIDIPVAQYREPVTVALDSSGQYTKETLVDENNVLEFVRLKSKFKLTESISEEILSIREGLQMVLPLELLEHFNEAEFSLLVNGETQIDVDDWERHTDFTGGAIKFKDWFFRCVRSFSNVERSALLNFVTGSGSLPAQGFSKLYSLVESKHFTITIGGEVESLPTASTCFNLLKLPNYASYEVLRAKLLVAIRYGSQGFSFA